MPDFDYRGARCRLLPGEMLCLMTDGVTEAQTAAGELYGNERLQQLLLRTAAPRRPARARWSRRCTPMCWPLPPAPSRPTT